MSDPISFNGKVERAYFINAFEITINNEIVYISFGIKNDGDDSSVERDIVLAMSHQCLKILVEHSKLAFLRSEELKRKKGNQNNQ